MSKIVDDSEAEATRLLLVEDEAIVALSEKQTIERYGYEVVTAHSGESAVETAGGDPRIGLVLMDVDLGEGIDGTEAAQRILQRREVPIVFLTAHKEQEYVERVENITNYGYVLKDSGEFVLLQSIRMALRLFDAHQDTRARQRQYRSLLDNAPLGITVLDRDMRVLAVNTKGAEVLNQTPDGMVNRELSEFFTKEDFAWRLKNINQVLEEGSPQTFEVTWNRRIFRNTAIPTHTRQGFNVQIVIEDVTEIRERERELQTIFDSAGDAMFIHDMKGTVREANSTACERLGYTKAELRGMPLQQLDSNRFAATVHERIKACRSYGHCSFDTEHVTKDGMIKPMEVRASVIRYREMSAILSVARDQSTSVR